MTQVQLAGTPTAPTNNGNTGGRIGPTAIRQKYDEGVQAIRSETMRYWENLSFLQGQQWIFYSSVTNRLEAMNRDDSRVQMVSNRMASTVRRLLSKAVKRPLQFEVVPTAADDASVEGARIAESILASEARDNNWENLREELTIAALTGGTGLLCLDWDPSGGDPLDTDLETGRHVGTGAAQLTALSIVEAVTEPGTRDIEYAQWWIKAQAVPCKEAQIRYDLKETPAADANASITPIQRRVLSLNAPVVPQNLCLVLTYYERPCKEYPQGQVCVVIGGKVVDGPYNWPFPFTDRLNVVAVRETKVLSRWTGDTIVSQAVPLQAAYNMVQSSLVEHTKLAGNTRLMWPLHAGDAVDSLSDLPGEIVEYAAVQGLPAPGWLNAPPLPADAFQLSDKLEAQMDDILGVHDVTRGEAPRNIESGSGLAILAEQDDTPIGKLVKDVGNAWGRLATMLLETYENEVEDTRMARVDYPHQVSQTVPWNGAALQGQTTAVVPYESIKPVTDAEIFTRASEYFKIGAFRDAAGQPDVKAFARYIAISGGEANFLEATDPDIAKASREDAELSLGQPRLPARFDNHATHIEIHNDYRKSSRYERLPDQLKQLVDLHVQAHEVLAAEDAAEARNRQLQAMETGGMELAAAASANRGGRPMLNGMPEPAAPEGLVTGG